MTRRLRLLVVEDNPADADFIADALQDSGSAGYHIESVSRLSAALSRLERKDIDVVLTDLGLPDSEGLSTLHTLRESVQDIPVVVLTGTDDQDLAVAAVRDGAQDYLVKGQFGGSLLKRSIRYAVERTRIETERKILEAQLRQSQKMESVGLLAGGVAHEFNNMLVVILGNTELALRLVDPSSTLHTDLVEVQKAAERSAELTRQLLAFARNQPVAPRELDLNTTVPEMLSMLQRLIGEDIAVAWQPAARLWSIRMDPSQMDQILTNLVINARHAIAGTGTLTLATANRVIDTAYCAMHAGVVPGEYVQLTVTDTGSGMDAVTVSRMYEPFFTTKDVGQGTGLGLSLVYGAVHQNGGFIMVTSAPGAGTSLEIHLPRHAGG